MRKIELKKVDLISIATAILLIVLIIWFIKLAVGGS